LSFAADTSMQAAGDGRYEGRVAEGWDIRGNANGGYLLALTGRTLVAHTGRPDPVTVTAHYLNPVPAGPARIDCEIIRAGRRFVTARACLARGERALVHVTGTFADLGAIPKGPERMDGGPPELPPPERCVARGEEHPGSVSPLVYNIDVRLHPEDAGYGSGQPSGRALMRGWFRVPGADAVEPVGLLLAADCFPPTIFNADLPAGWTPTLELTVHVRARPAPGWVRARFASRFVGGGLLEEDGELWDASGKLVAQSRQLALVPRGE